MHITRRLSVLLLCGLWIGGQLISEALADPVGLQTVTKTDDPADPAFLCNDEFDVDVCNVLVEFSHPADNLLSVAFSSISTDDPNGLFQIPAAMGGTNTAPSDLFLGLFPELICDSFVTIGLKNVPVGAPDCTIPDADFDADVFNTPASACSAGPNAGSPCFSDADCPMGACANVAIGGWFCVNPPSGQGNPDPETMELLIAQFTVQRGFSVSGELTVFYNNGDVPFPAFFTCGGVCCSNNSECDDGNPCTDDFCGCGLPGADDFGCVYVPVAAGTACVSQADTACDNPNACDGAGSCLENHEPAGTPCPDDGNDCTDDVCDGNGACSHPPLPAGSACGSSDDSACDDPDTCDGNGMCLANTEPAGTGCELDADVCTVEQCDRQGACVSAGFLNCDDEDPCTSDSCGFSGCVNTPVDADDGIDCTVDQCIRGMAVHTPDDSLCDDDNICTDDICSPPDGGCIHPLVPGAMCLTDEECGGDGVCNTSQCVGCVCSVVVLPACDDENECTDDFCSVPDGGCIHPLFPDSECAEDSDCGPTEHCAGCLCLPNMLPGDDDDDDDDDGRPRPPGDDDDTDLPGEDDDPRGDDDDG